MSARALPVRRAAGSLAEDELPIALPHLEPDPARFLGEPIDLDEDDHALLSACDGQKPLHTWTPDEQARIQRWHTAGLVLGAPPPRTHRTELTVLSPHPDDAQLAVGALLAATGARVVDVFTEETWTRRPYYRARPELTSNLLLAEERLACRVLDAELTLLGHPDGETRPAWRNGFLVDDPAAVAAAEPDLLDRLTHDLASALTGTSGPVLVPLAVGGHVDHILVRESITTLTTTGHLDPERVLFYEDMPYSLFTAPTSDATPLLIRADNPRRKREAMWAYRLQVTDGVAARIMRYGNALGQRGFAERLWVPRAAAAHARALIGSLAR